MAVAAIVAAGLIFVRRRQGSKRYHLSDSLYSKVEDNSKVVEFSTSSGGTQVAKAQVYSGPAASLGGGGLMNGIADTDYNEL